MALVGIGEMEVRSEVGRWGKRGREREKAVFLGGRAVSRCCFAEASSLAI